MILDCKKTIELAEERIKHDLIKYNIKPTLAIVRVLGDDASGVYVNLKVKKCNELGINSKVIELENSISNHSVLNVINDLNKNDNINAILVQLPLPNHLNEYSILEAIDSKKDADCLKESNIGKLFTNNDLTVPCTPKGIMNVLKDNNVELEGKDVLIINRSMLVGKPLVELFQRENATVTLAHSKTKNLRVKMMCADIIVTAVAKTNFIDYDFLEYMNGHNKEVKKITTIIDVSMNRTTDNFLCGDVENNNKNNRNKIEELENVFVTPVPGGIGGTTVISLLENTIKLAKVKLNNNRSKEY